MYDFEFLSPHSVAEAVAMLRDHEESKLLAGGQTFIPVLKQRLSRPSHVIDLSGACLAGISFQSDRIVIGAMTTHATVVAHAVIGERIPGISRLACVLDRRPAGSPSWHNWRIAREQRSDGILSVRGARAERNNQDRSPHNQRRRLLRWSSSPRLLSPIRS